MTTKGHWPKGKRRNSPGESWDATLRALRVLLDSPPIPQVSRSGLAAWCKIGKEAVRKWLRGGATPPEAVARKVASWVAWNSTLRPCDDCGTLLHQSMARCKECHAKVAAAMKARLAAGARAAKHTAAANQRKDEGTPKPVTEAAKTPMHHDTGGGRRVVRKGNRMS